MGVLDVMFGGRPLSDLKPKRGKSHRRRGKAKKGSLLRSTGRTLKKIGHSTIASSKKAAKEAAAEAKRLRKLAREAGEQEKKKKALERKYKKVMATPTKYAPMTRKARR